MIEYHKILILIHKITFSFSYSIGGGAFIESDKLKDKNQKSLNDLIIFPTTLKSIQNCEIALYFHNYLK